MLRVTKTPGHVLRELAGTLPRAVQAELAREQPKMHRRIIKAILEWIRQRFVQQRDPRGRFWKHPAQLTFAMRRRSGFRGRKAGITRSRRMMNSFEGKSRRGQVIVQSKLRRGGHNVAEVYSSEFTFFSKLVGKRVRHPARPILAWTKTLEAIVREICAEHLLKAVRRAYAGVARRLK